MYTIALRSGLSAEDAADVFQDVFLKVYRNLYLLDRPESVRFWLSTIARRQAWLTRCRVRCGETGRDPTGEAGALDVPVADPLPDAELERMDRLFLLHKGLERLDNRCRSLLERLFFADYPPDYDQAAIELGIRRGSMGPTRARCLQKLRRELESLGFRCT